MYAFEVDGMYFDAGTIDGYRDLLNSIWYNYTVCS
jgi:hypothetical protein